MFQHLLKRLPENFPLQASFAPALEIWSVVQSRPEPQLAILSFGKRDASYDIDLPVPHAWFNAERHGVPQPVSSQWEIFKLNDQHAFLRLPPEASLAVGDFVSCGISHPCTTFDKWKLLYLVDDAYTIVDAIKTYF